MMDIVLDNKGNELQVEAISYYARIMVAIDERYDRPIACIANSLDWKRLSVWEDSEYSSIQPLKRLQEFKYGDTPFWEIGGIHYSIRIHEAYYFSILSLTDNKVISCSAMKLDGEGFLLWSDIRVRGSMTLYKWALCTIARINEEIYIPLGITKTYAYINKDNISSNKHHINLGAKFVGTKDMYDCANVCHRYNKYESDMLTTANLKEVMNIVELYG